MKTVSKHLSLVLVLLLSTTVAHAQYSGTSYIQAGAGLSLHHQDGGLGSAQHSFSLSYGYVFSHRVTLDVPVSYQSVQYKHLDGSLYSLQPTIYYALSRRDKYRLEAGAILGLGYEVYQKPSGDLLDVTGHLASFTPQTGVALRYVHLIRYNLGVSATYRYVHQYQGLSGGYHSIGATLSVYL